MRYLRLLYAQVDTLWYMRIQVGLRLSARFAGCALAGIAACWMLPAQLVAADNNVKPNEKAAEEVILEKIDQLQGELDELRAALAELKKERQAPAAPVAALTPSSAPALL